MHTVPVIHTSAPRAVARLPHHFETSEMLAAAPDAVFAGLDNFAQLGSHMTQSSWMMAGSRMHYEFDAGGGRQLGSVVRLRGAVLGIALFINEVVT